MTDNAQIPFRQRPILRPVREGLRAAGDQHRIRGAAERAHLQRELSVVPVDGGSIHPCPSGPYLGPAFTSAGLSTKIMLGTMSSTSDPSIVSAVMADATANGYIKVLGYQWTMKTSVTSANSSYHLPVWQTEHQCGNYPWVSGYKTTAPNDQAYAVESWGLIRDWIKAGVTAYSAWNMVLDTVGDSIDSQKPWAQNALLTVDSSAKVLNVTPTYYVFRHLSQLQRALATRCWRPAAVTRWRSRTATAVSCMRRGQLRIGEHVHPRGRRQKAAVRHARQRLGHGRLRAVASSHASRQTARTARALRRRTHQPGSVTGWTFASSGGTSGTGGSSGKGGSSGSGGASAGGSGAGGSVATGGSAGSGTGGATGKGGSAGAMGAPVPSAGIA